MPASHLPAVRPAAGQVPSVPVPVAPSSPAPTPVVPPALLAPVLHQAPPTAPVSADSGRASPTVPPGLLRSSLVRVPAPPPTPTADPSPPELLAPLPPRPIAEPAKERQGAPAPLSPAVEPPAAEPDEPLPSLEICAALTASGHLLPAQQGQALAEAELDEQRWRTGGSHWARVVEGELRCGERATLGRFDSAYVAELERRRGPIAPEDHARIDLATERGCAEQALQELGLPIAGRMRIQRHWIRRLCTEPEARARYFQALGTPRTTEQKTGR
jgi:hypothetical protein